MKRWILPGPLVGLAVLLLGTSAFGENVVRVGYQKSGPLLLLRAEGVLEKNLRPLGYRVEWREFPSGPPLLEALSAGAIDLGHSGDAPLLFAQAGEVPFLYLAATVPNPESTALLVPRDSPVKSISDLKGKRVGFAKGSSSHYFIAQLLQRAGLKFRDIQPVFLQPGDAGAAFQAGNLDAWGVWDPYAAAGEVAYGARLLANGTGTNNHREFYFGRKGFLQQYPAVVEPFLLALRESGRQAEKDPMQTAHLLAAKLGIPEPILQKSERRDRRYDLEAMTPAIVAEQQKAADTFFELGVLPRKLQVADAVYQSNLKL